MRVAPWGISLLLALVVLGYAVAVRRYGLELADEGVLLAQIDRVAHGQTPYRDFHTGYGPAMFLLNAGLFGLFGASTTTVRVGLAVVQAWRVGLAAALVGGYAGRVAAVVVGTALLGFFLPIAPGICVPSSIPYPAWYADALGLAALVLVIRARTRPALVAVGMVWGLVFAFKQNSGLLGLGATVVTLVLAPSADETSGRSGPGVAVGLGLVGAACLLLRDFLDPTLAVVFVVPLVPLAVAVARRRVSAATVLDLASLGAGFGAVAGATVAAMVTRAGAEAVRADLFQIGSDVVQVYHRAYPTWHDVLAQTEGAAVARAARIVGDGAWFAIFPLVHLFGALLVLGGRVRSRAGVAIVVAAAVGYLALYPRMDFWHLLPLATTSLVAATVVTSTVGGGAERLALVALGVASVVRVLPTLPVLAALQTTPSAAAPSGRLQVRFDLLTDERTRRVPDVVAALRGRARVAGFPALGIVNFALGVPSPWRHDYFFPGRPGPAEEQALADEVRRRPPDAVVVLEAETGAFAEAFAAHAAMARVLRERFVEAERIGPYRILVPRAEPDA